MILPPAQAPATPLARARRPRGRPARPRLIAWVAFPAQTAVVATKPATDPVRLVTYMGTWEPVPRSRPGTRPTAGTMPAGEPECVPVAAAGTPTARAPIPPALVAQPIAAARPTRPPAHATPARATHLIRKSANSCVAPHWVAQATARSIRSAAAAPSRRPAMRTGPGRTPGVRVRGVPPARRRREPAWLEPVQIPTSATARALATRQPGFARTPPRTPGAVMTGMPAPNTIPARRACAWGHR